MTQTERRIYCPNVASIQSAMAIARNSGYKVTAILDPKFTYQLDAELLIQGAGTTIEGNGALFNINNHYTGVGGGSGFLIQPTFGPTQPFANQTNGVWSNPKGNVSKLTAALGGTGDEYNENAPFEYGNGFPPSAQYTEYWPVTTLADDITIRNIRMTFTDPQAMASIHARYTRRLTLDNVSVLNAPNGGDGGFMLVGCEWPLVQNCSVPFGSIGCNSSTWGRFLKNTARKIGFEEMSRWNFFWQNVAEQCETHSITSEGNSFVRNRFTAKDSSMQLEGGTRTLVTQNICAGGIWLGGNTRNMVILGNSASAFANYSGSDANTPRPDSIAVEQNNSWQAGK